MKIKTLNKLGVILDIVLVVILSIVSIFFIIEGFQSSDGWTLGIGIATLVVAVYFGYRVKKVSHPLDSVIMWIHFAIVVFSQAGKSFASGSVVKGKIEVVISVFTFVVVAYVLGSKSEKS